MRKGGLTRQAGHTPKVRKADYTRYQFRGHDVCRNLFRFVYALGEREEKNLRLQLHNVGPGEKMHGGVSKSALNRSLPLETHERAVKFIQTYAIQHGLILPGRIPSVRNYLDVIILPSTLTKLEVYNVYSRACESENTEPISQTMWYQLWDTLCPNISVQRPRTDLCTRCQQSMISLSQLHNLSEEVKQERIQASLAHLDRVQIEREYYKHVCESSRAALPDIFLQTSFLRQPRSFDGCMHYSFDYAQQVCMNVVSEPSWCCMIFTIFHYHSRCSYRRALNKLGRYTS